VLCAPRAATGTFKSDLWLHNSSAFPVLVRITFRARGAGIAPVRRDVTVAAGSSVFLPNVVSSLFGKADQQGSLSLEYLVPASQSGATPLVHAFSRSYVDQANPADGSFGQLVSEEPESTWSAASKVVPGIFEGSGFISTVMAANLDATAGQVTVELLDRQGVSVGSAVLGLDANGVRFQTIARLFPATASHTGPFTARFTSNGIRFAASATLLDAGSQDQIFIPATPVVSGVDHGEVWFPRVVRNRGQFNTFLVSKLVAYNPASERRQLTLELWLRGQDNTAPLVVQREVEAGQSLLVDDVVRDLFALDEGTGALHVTWSGPQGPDMRIISLTFAQTQGQGKRFGTLVDSARAEAAVTTRGVDFGAELTGVSRSSYGAVSLSASPTVLRLTLKSAAGIVLGTADIGLQPRQHFERSLAGIFTGLADGSNQFIETQVVSGGPVLTYLANINVSGDVFYVPGHAE
jgi:hypothetical protein